jgi:hypothetical protein
MGEANIGAPTSHIIEMVWLRGAGGGLSLSHGDYYLPSRCRKEGGWETAPCDAKLLESGVRVSACWAQALPYYLNHIGNAVKHIFNRIM